MKSYQLIEILKQCPWRSKEYSPMGNGLWRVPSMLTDEEKKMLSYITERVFEGKGHILDLGCSIGGSTAFLAHGLSNSSYADGLKIRSFDLFEAGEYERKTFFPNNNLEVPVDYNTLPLFEMYTAPWFEFIEVNAGNILDYTWSGEPIEILFVDIMKSAELYDYVVETFFPCLIPGESILILQDYLYTSGPWHSIVMELLKNKFTRISHTRKHSVIYLCTDRITQEDIENCKWENISHAKKIESIARAAVSWDADNQEIIFKILSDYLEGRYEDWGQNFNTALRQKKNIENSIENHQEEIKKTPLRHQQLMLFLAKKNRDICELGISEYWEKIGNNLLEKSPLWKELKTTITNSYPSIKIEDYLILILPALTVGDVTGFLSLLISLHNKFDKKIILFMSSKPHLVDLYDLFEGEHIFAHYFIDPDKYNVPELVIQPIQPGFPSILNIVLPTTEDIPGKTCENFAYKGFHLNIYQRSMGLSSDAKITFPNIKGSDKENAIARFNQQELIAGKTILIAPISNTIDRIFGSNKKLMPFWNDIYKVLKIKGFSIAINGLNKGEKFNLDIDNERLKIVEISLKEIIPFVEYGGFFMGARSGLCDLLGFAQCRKKVIYPLGSAGKGLQNFGYEEYVVNPENYNVETIIQNWIE